VAAATTPTTATTPATAAKTATSKQKPANHPVKKATTVKRVAPNPSQTDSYASVRRRNPTVVDPRNTHPTIPGPQPGPCLASAGMLGARQAREPGVWEANWGTTSTNNLNAMVFVDGPYKNRQAASDAARTLLGTEYGASGGRWEVSASLPSRLNAQVHKVARCLGGLSESAGRGPATGKSYTF
jgi:hypothetical protein